MNASSASGTRRIVAQGASVAGTRIALIGVAFVSSIVVARALAVEERGRFGLLMAVGTLGIQFGNLGLPVANTYLVARRPEKLPALVANTTRSFLWIAASLGLLSAATIHLIPAWSSLSGACTVMVWCVALAGLAQSLVQNLLFGVFRFSAGNVVELVARLGATAGMVVAWRLGGTTAVWFAGVFAVFTGVATGWGMRAGGIRPSIRGWDERLWREQVRIGSRVYLACLASFLLTRLPLYAVESRGGLKGLAFFTQAMLVADTMLVLPASLGTVLFPSLASTPDSGFRIRSTLRLAAIVACVMLMAVAAAVWLGPFAFPFVYGRAYAASMPIFVAMLPGVAALGVCSVMQNALSANGYPWAAVASPAAGVLAVILGLQFTDTVIGCARAYSMGAVTMFLFSSVAWWFHRHDWSEIDKAAPGATDPAT